MNDKDIPAGPQSGPLLGLGSSDGLGAGSEARCGCIACMKERGDGQTYGRIFWPQHMLQMTLCPTCGNKRCPHANDHRHACTDSNEPGQAGSAYA